MFFEINIWFETEMISLSHALDFYRHLLLVLSEFSRWMVQTVVIFKRGSLVGFVWLISVLLFKILWNLKVPSSSYPQRKNTYVFKFFGDFFLNDFFVRKLHLFKFLSNIPWFWVLIANCSYCFLSQRTEIKVISQIHRRFDSHIKSKSLRKRL